MKVLSITPFLRGAPIHPYSGGKSAVSLKITNVLVDEGHNVFVLPWSKEYIWEETLFKISNDSSSYATALPTLYFPRLTDLTKEILSSFLKKEALKNPRQYIWNYFRNSLYDKDTFLKEAMDRVNPDIVHIHYTHSDVIDFYRKLNSSVPVILTHHSNRVSKKVTMFDYVIFVSKFQYDIARRRDPAIEKKSCVIYNSVSDIYFKSTEPQKTNNILYLSRFKPQKGLKVLLDSFSIDKKLAHYQLSVIGDGEMEEQYKSFVRRNNLGNVKFLGRLSSEKNAEEMEKSTLFVVPSYGEGFALIYIEALCMGLPVIGYPPNIREHNELFGMTVGYEFDANNESPQQLADLIDKAMNSELTEIDYRKKIMKKARSLFSEETFRKRYLDVYQKVVTKRADDISFIKGNTSDSVLYEPSSQSIH